MATSSRQSSLFGLQDWQRIYQTYRETDFQSYDYETLRKSFIDYLTQYYPETFNDFIESSEFVALLDIIAFMGQALAFRGDLNARENFMDTAERRDSVVKLANLVSYTPKRNIAGQGLVKITAISTSENIQDVNGTNLSNTTILWNDPANANWQEQFNSVINAALVNTQRIGRPGNTQTILGVKTDEYAVNIPGNQLPVVSYLSQVDGITMDFQLISATSLGSESLYEIPPQPGGIFNMLYRNDKLGYGSANTGFFFYFKQGTLQNVDFMFPERIENNIQNIDVQGINNTDTWLYQLDTANNISAAWTKVDNVYVSTNFQGDSARKIFSVASRFNDQVTYAFGDGVFGEIPVGPFRTYVRSSNSLTYVIDPTEMQGVVVNIDYVSRQGRIETLTMTFSLQTSANTAQARESLTEIKQRAPARYYTQNRMVNGEDYTNFPFTLYNSIIKSKAVNRTSIGVSRNLDLLDPTGKYSSTNVFADDGAVYVSDAATDATFYTTNSGLIIDFLNMTLPALLSSPAAIQYYQTYYPRYNGDYNGDDCYWQQSTASDTSVTGYFYYIPSYPTPVPISVGNYSSANMKYITKGAQIKFLPPTGYYFDKNNRLQYGTANPASGDKTFIWVGVEQVIGDGDNFGNGELSSGSGPITLSDFVPTGAYIDLSDGIIPSFENVFSAAFKQEVIAKINLHQNFYLVFDNSIQAAQARWSLVQSPVPTTYFISFTFNSIDSSYVVNIKNRTYYFGSVSEVRFFFDTAMKVFDPVTGKTIRDFVEVLRTNQNNTGTAILGSPYYLSITGQTVESDGYPDDYSVQITSLNTEGISYDPDFFDTIVNTSPMVDSLVFFRIITDINDLYRRELLPPGLIIQSYALLTDIENVLYEYASGTIFYAEQGNGVTSPKFYQSQVIPASIPQALELIDVTDQYTYAIGRGDLYFQYRHNSSNSTRIDPATTNIVDVYVVTQSYYTAYQNWLVDTTGTVPLPDRPTIQELEQTYGGLDSYKMISDSVVVNSVVFKPLFGAKAPLALQGKIKVIKNPNVTASDSQIRSSVLSALNSYFTIDKWDFGDTFYFSELTAYLHVQLAGLISSVVVVSNNPNQTFGDLYEIRSAPDEIFVNGATASDIVVISALTPATLQR